MAVRDTKAVKDQPAAAAVIKNALTDRALTAIYIYYSIMLSLRSCASIK